jgi:hypothetical protein
MRLTPTNEKHGAWTLASAFDDRENPGIATAHTDIAASAASAVSDSSATNRQSEEKAVRHWT